MISQSVNDCDMIGFKRAMYFTNDRMLTINFFTIKNTSEGLIILIKIDSRVVLIKSEFFPFS